MSIAKSVQGDQDKQTKKTIPASLKTRRDARFEELTPLMTISLTEVQLKKFKKKESLLSKTSMEYMSNYGVDNYMELVSREHLLMFKNHFDHGKEFQIVAGTPSVRAIVISKLFEASAHPGLDTTNKAVVFQGIGQMDRFYNQLGLHGIDSLKNPKHASINLARFLN